MAASTLGTRTTGMNGIICSSTDEGMVFVGFAEQQLGIGRKQRAGRGAGQHGGILADVSPY